MSISVLSHPGSIGLSIAGATDHFKIIANILMLGARLIGYDVTGDMIEDALQEEGMGVNADNIAKVRAFFPAK